MPPVRPPRGTAVLVRLVPTLLLGAPAAAQVQWTGQPARIGLGAAYLVSRGEAIFYGGRTASGAVLDETLALRSTGFARLNAASSPGGLTEFAIAPFPPRGELVLFGGVTGNGVRSSTTWIFDGNSWGNTNTGTSPPARTGHAMAFDPVRNVIVLFGGTGNAGSLDDTWEYNGTTWTRRFPTTLPLPRYYHAMAFDPIGQGVLMLGGNGGGLADGTWRWNGTDWVLAQSGSGFVFGLSLTTTPAGVLKVGGTSPPFVGGAGQIWNGSSWQPVAGGPNDRAHHIATYDAARGVVVVHGGSTGIMGSPGTPAFADTWEWHPTNGWAQQSYGAQPGGRTGRGLVFDSVRNELFAYGGQSNEELSDGTVWRRRGSTWSGGTSAYQPRIGRGGTMVFDTVRGVAMQLGSWEWVPGGGYWFPWAHHEWNGTNWTLHSGTLPPSRISHAMAFDTARGRAVLYGGTSTCLYGNCGSTPLDDTWEWDGATWQQRAPAHTPGTLAGTMGFDARRGESILVGRRGTGPCETWSWNGIDWTQLTPVTAAGAVGPMAWDAGRERLVMPSGGVTVWEWDGTNWIARTAANAPSSLGPVAYDPILDRVVMLCADGSTWEYGAESPGGIGTYGIGCVSAGPQPTLTYQNRPWIGSTLRVALGNAPAPSFWIGVSGFDNVAWNGLPLPANLQPFGMPGCLVLVAPTSTVFLATPDWQLTIPNQPAFVGAQFFLQGLLLAPGSNPAGARPTNGLRATVGSR